MNAAPIDMPVDVALRGTIRLNEPMSKHTVWAVGGPADMFFVPADLEDLQQYLCMTSGVAVSWLGLGSNLLVRDGGIRGAVISTAGRLDVLEEHATDEVLVQAGVACAKVARFCSRLGLAGAEFLAGIPGTMGGALAMNAGAFGGETWSIVSAVETLDRKGCHRTRASEEFEVGYRHVAGPHDEWFVAAHLSLTRGDAGESTRRIRDLLRQRAESQPTGQRSCGSVFRNPPGDYAGRLIESCGLKGTRIGGAAVSEKHANFIINEGAASAEDIERLIERVRSVVEEQHGVVLVPEVRVVGERQGVTTCI